MWETVMEDKKANLPFIQFVIGAQSPSHVIQIPPVVDRSQDSIEDEVKRALDCDQEVVAVSQFFNQNEAQNAVQVNPHTEQRPN